MVAVILYMRGYAWRKFQVPGNLYKCGSAPIITVVSNL